jgi:hypothetical protein
VCGCGWRACVGRAVGQRVWMWCRRVEVGCLFAAGPAVSVGSQRKQVRRRIRSISAERAPATATPAPNVPVTLPGERRLAAINGERRAGRVLWRSTPFIMLQPPRRRSRGPAQQIIRRSLHRCRILSGNWWNIVEGREGLTFTLTF